MDRPELLKIFVDQQMPASEKLLKLFFETTETSQSAGRQFVERLARRTEDTDILKWGGSLRPARKID